MENLVRELRKDADLGVFLSADCNVSAIASAVVARDSASPGLDRSDAFRRSSIASLDESGGAPSHSEQFIRRIDEAVRRIDRVIGEHVTEHHMELLGQVGSVDGLQGQVSTVQASVQHLQSAVAALETSVREQHRTLQETIQKHRNVERCGEIVRRVLRFHQLSERVLGSPLATAGLLGSGASTSSGAGRGVVAANHAEMVTLALAIREMETLVENPNFEELSVVRAKLPAIRKLSAAVKREVRADLRAGMQSVSQAEVGDALQVLFYLGGLAPTVQGAVNDVIQEVERSCGAAIAEDKLYRRNSLSSGANGTSSSNSASSEAGPSATHAVVQKADIWKAIQDVFEAIRTHALQVWNLQRVLAKMVDPGANSRYIDLVIGKDEPTLFATFWEVTCAIVRELFASMLNYRSAIKTVLVSEYPRMREQAHRVLNDLHAATNQNAGSDYLSEQSRGKAAKAYATGIARSVAERNQLLDSMSPLFDAFTDRLYRRLSNPIQLMFPQSSNFHASPPGRSDMQTLARTIFAELDQVGKDPVLLKGSLKQIRKAVTLFCTNVKKIMHTGKPASATTPSFGRTTAQAHNVSLVSVLGILDDAIEEVERRVVALATESEAAVNAESTRSISMVRSTSSDTISEKKAKRVCAKELTPCHDLIGDMQYALLGYYLQSLASILEGVFAKMHDESFADRAPSTPGGSSAGGPQQRHSLGGTHGSSSTSGSKYMQEFTSVFAVVLDEHLRRLPPSNVVSECVGDFVCRLISVFVRHASLLRPLQENGKLRLANDMTQLELRLEHVMPLKNLGAPYDELRAFRQLIFLDSASLLRDQAVDKIRPSNVWHHLMARAPAELQLPHQMKRWTVSKYIDWLDTEMPVDIRASFTPPPGPFAWKDLPLGYPCLKDRRLALLTEKSVWKEVSACLDAYAQRVSAASGVDLSPVYDLVQESGPILLAGYEVAYPV